MNLLINKNINKTLFYPQNILIFPHRLIPSKINYSILCQFYILFININSHFPQNFRIKESAIIKLYFMNYKKIIIILC